MFLKRQKRRKGGEDYAYWELVRTHPMLRHIDCSKGVDYRLLSALC